ncbi:sodium hydrogen exchanger family protein [Cryptosporidium andersoni]|uniref:Sodium hydrogen exchanger family protein n=1 Tax=Cryptosporidium andersoni TaxID=117008 RepID=A0A1J4MV95_9CRYT|nr:sodium hydrogen exchanger family protein [Cryptosporidium andersoni]
MTLNMNELLPPEISGELVMTIVCVFGICVLSSAILEALFGNRTLMNGKFRVPLTAALFAYGIALDYVLRSFDFGIVSLAIRKAEGIHPNIIFTVLLPICLYESSSQLSYHIFKRNLMSSVLLALPGVIVSMILTAVYMRYVVGGVFDWTCAFLISSVLSATDPVAVIASLHQLNAPEKLASLVDGEALLNDGAAVVFFQVCKNILINRTLVSSVIFTSSWIFIRCAIGGPLLGIIFGGSVYLLFRFIRSPSDVQVIVAITAVYTLFLVSELIHSSGVLAVVVYGLFMSSRGTILFKPKTQEIHHTIINFLSKLGNNMIFLLAGIVSARLFRPYITNISMLCNLILLFFAISIVRGIMVLVLLPLLSRIGYGLTMKEAIILIWGGLRGGVSLALAMSLESEDYLDNELKEQITFYVAGTVLLTLLINGTTVELIYKKLQLYKTSKFHRLFFSKVMKSIDEEYKNVCKQQLNNHWFFQAHPGLLELCNTFIPKLGNSEMTESGDIILCDLPEVATFLQNVKNTTISFVTQTPPIPDNISRESLIKQRTISCLTRTDDMEDSIFEDALKLKNIRNSLLGIDLSEPITTTDSNNNILNLSRNHSNLIHSKDGFSDNSSMQRSSLGSNFGRVKIGRQIYIGHMVLNTVWQFYDLLFHDHIISGSALVVLKRAISKALYVCDELNSPIHYSFTSEWNSIKDDLWCYSNMNETSENLYSDSLFDNENTLNKHWTSHFCSPLLGNYKKILQNSLQFRDVEVLMSFVSARFHLLTPDFQELQSYLGYSSIQLFQNQIIEAQQYLEALSTSPEQYNTAVSHIAVNILFNAKNEAMEHLVKSRLLLDEDEEKLVDLCEDRRFLLSSSLSREVISTDYDIGN